MRAQQLPPCSIRCSTCTDYCNPLEFPLVLLYQANEHTMVAVDLTSSWVHCQAPRKVGLDAKNIVCWTGQSNRAITAGTLMTHFWRNHLVFRWVQELQRWPPDPNHPFRLMGSSKAHWCQFYLPKNQTLASICFITTHKIGGNGSCKWVCLGS